MKCHDPLWLQKKYSLWIPLLLTDDHKKKRMGAVFAFYTHYHQAANKLLDYIVIGDETVSHKTPEIKCESIEWHRSKSPTKQEK